MSEIEWSPAIRVEGGQMPKEIGGLVCAIKEREEWIYGAEKMIADRWHWHSEITHYRIPMSDYKRITGMPEWSEAPEWAQWLAQDADGLWAIFDKCSGTDRDETQWIGCGMCSAPMRRGTVLGDWRDTLQERPRDQLDTHPNSEPDADQYSVGADTFPQYARDELVKRAQERSLNPYDAPGFLEAALGHMEDRKTTYDAPEGERSMGRTVAAFNAIRGRDLSEEEGWLFMVLLKAVRTQQGAFRADNYEDGAAYFALQGEAAARDRKHGQ